MAKKTGKCPVCLRTLLLHARGMCASCYGRARQQLGTCKACGAYVLIYAKGQCKACRAKANRQPG